ncbi:LIM domain-containing protein WLIM2b isoform X2 [Physcomitrium patens]
MALVVAQPKCKTCDKTVYLVDQLRADGVLYHKACFRCHHCKGTLKRRRALPCHTHMPLRFAQLGNYASLEGVLYCRPHFDQLLKTTGSFEKSFDQQASMKGQSGYERFQTPSKGSTQFVGTQEKCVACGKTVYPLEKTTVEDLPYHKSCFKCAHGSCTISVSSYASLEGRLYCKHHYSQLFKEKGNYSRLTKPPAMKPTTKNDIFAYSWV